MAEPRPQAVTIDTIKERLLAQIDGVVARYAPEAAGSYHKGPCYYTLNPGRADRRVGSFVVWMDGRNAGRWRDYAVEGPEGHGDLIDLIGLSLGLSSPAERIREARRFLGLDAEDPATRMLRDAQARRLKAEREARGRDDADRAEWRRRNNEALWLSAERDLRGTPVDLYLQGRGIDLAQIGHAPGAMRYHAEAWYRCDDGRVLKVPAMLTAIALRGRTVAVHRTYLRQDAARGWIKHDRLPGLPGGKWVSGDYTGGVIRLSNGLGPQGGRGAPLSQCPPGTRLLVAEGIENGLSALALRALAGLPPIRVVATGMVHNLGRVELPANVAEVTLAADNDVHPAACAALERAVELHRAAGRVVRVWRSRVPGEDLNDALRRALADAAGRATA